MCLLPLHVPCSLLQAQSPSVSTVTSVDGRDTNQTFNSVNVTLAISAQSSNSAMQVSRATSVQRPAIYLPRMRRTATAPHGAHCFGSLCITQLRCGAGCQGHAEHHRDRPAAAFAADRRLPGPHVRAAGDHRRAGHSTVRQWRSSHAASLRGAACSSREDLVRQQQTYDAPSPLSPHCNQLGHPCIGCRTFLCSTHILYSTQVSGISDILLLDTALQPLLSYNEIQDRAADDANLGGWGCKLGRAFGAVGAGAISALVVVPMVAAICLTAGACLLWQRRKRRASQQLKGASSEADKLDSDSEPRSSGGLAESTSPLQQSWQALHSHNPLLSFTSFGLVTR